MKSSIAKSAVINTTVSVGISIVSLIASFVTRSYFIDLLGKEFLGLNGVFSSVLSVLSLSELGLGTAIVYFLYEPLLQQNWDRINALMRLYKKVYSVIGVGILLVGLLITPFLRMFIHSDIPFEMVMMYYMLFLLNSVVSYFFTYNRSLLIADQQNYLVVVNDFIFKFIGQLMQIGVLLLWKNFTLFLIIQILFTLFSNVSITFYVSKKYKGLLTTRTKFRVEKNILHELKKNVIGSFANKLGSVVVNGMDNILISVFVSLGTVGIYSNYVLITTAIQTIQMSASNSVTAVVGAIGATGRDEDAHNFFELHNFFNFTMTYLAAAMIMAIINPFIEFWIGSKYLLNPHIVFIIAITYFANRMRSTVSVFSEAYGLAWKTRYKPLIESALNLSLSLFFLLKLKWGIEGVILPTFLTSFFFDTVFESYFVFKYVLHKKLIGFYITYVKYASVFAIAIVVSFWVSSYNFVGDSGSVFELVIKFAVEIFVLSIIFVLFLGRTKNFKDVILILKKRIKG